ncbi:MurR/RpiR family transcriptional regulator [Allocoprobacillus halotolerans]|uniref:MurR/RpiR family transcriptional regulator n=1 Tax=Allocoprobacillus halotolerans TaxID=2944914 RepID=A0ABY5HZJ1_9FIRM|nr:MurR/RpiR family transcriptional regulator [Allocoprobacillus halotolerans]UTY38240.1 MurR/RpiR family transcriptional regulator [Allocoprobacillus halotolerans]
MDIVLSRILKYLNGCLDDDHMYRIGLFVVHHYVEMEDYSLQRVMDEGNFTKDDILDFCKHLGFDTYEEFQSELVGDYMLRVSQIRARMLGVSASQLIEQLDSSYDKEAFVKELELICELIFKNKRVIVIGALYPTSIAVEFQTDFITFGKEVIQYHHFEKDFQFKKDDVVIFMSATGRTLNDYLKESADQNIHSANIVLMTQNVKYKKNNDLGANYVLQVPGRFDGIQFNYQIMMIFDILRIYYYTKYYI